MANISNVFRKDPKKSMRIIIKAFKKADSGTSDLYGRYFELGIIREQIDISQLSDKEFHSLVRQFIKIQSLSHEHNYILAAYGNKFPLKLVDFFAHRIRKKKRIKKIIPDRYDPIPYFPDEIIKMFKSHPQYLEVIEKVLEWTKIKKSIFRREGSNLLKKLAPNLEGNLRESLLKHIESEKKDKVIRVLKILNSYAQHKIIHYDLIKEVIKKSKGDKDIFQYAEYVIRHTGIITGEKGLVKSLKSKIDSLRDWKEDENIYVRKFAESAIESLREEIVTQEKIDLEREVVFKKGYF